MPYESTEHRKLRLKMEALERPVAKLLWNGIRVTGVSMLKGSWYTVPAREGVHFRCSDYHYHKAYNRALEAVGAQLLPNNSNSQEDYFEKDRWYFPTGCAGETAAVAAMAAEAEHMRQMIERRAVAAQHRAENLAQLRRNRRTI